MRKMSPRALSASSSALFTSLPSPLSLRAGAPASVRPRQALFLHPWQHDGGTSFLIWSRPPPRPHSTFWHGRRGISAQLSA